MEVDLEEALNAFFDEHGIDAEAFVGDNEETFGFPETDCL